MADNPPATPAPNPGPRPTLPGTSSTGRLKNPTTQLPVKRGGAGKIVVMLSSVAKPPPAVTQALPQVTPAVESAPKPAAPAPASTDHRPPPLPPKQVTPGNSQPAPSRPQLSATTYVKLPPKTAVPAWSSLSGKPVAPPSAPATPVSKAVPPPLPSRPDAVRGEPKKSGAQHIPPIKLNEPVAASENAAEDSIFLQKKPAAAPKPTPAPEPARSSVPTAPITPATPTSGPATPAGSPVSPAPTEARVPEGVPVSLDLFEKSQLPPAGTPPVPAPEAKERPAPLVAPPLLPPQRISPPPSISGAQRPMRPPPLPTITKPMASSVTPPSAPNAVPRLLEKASEPAREKLSPPLAKTVASPAPTPAPILHVAPPMLEKAPEPLAERLAPPHLPVEARKPETPPEVPTPPPILHVAPPMLEKAPEPLAERLAQPHLPVEARKPETPPEVPAPSAMHKAPAMIKSDPPPKPLLPPSQPKSMTSWFKKSTPLVVSSSSQKLSSPPPPVAEAKPALKPAVLPSRSLLVPAQIVEPPVLPPAETPGTAGDSKAPEKTPPVIAAPVGAVIPPPAITPAPVPASGEVAPVAIGAALAGATTSKPSVKAPSKAPLAPPPPSPAASPNAKAPVPLTRAQRAKKRRFFGLIFFWAVLFPLTIAVLFWGSLRFGRDTRVEGQVIPPPGTVLSNEVWIVTDFRSLASGISEDLAAERTPLMQEIQERQDHVQRAQADVAAREERIRLIEEEMAASKTEIDNIVKQARDATQQVWDVEGAQVDADYTSRMDHLQHTIADRAKSLNLKYQTDDTYHSPEVWANAYRLALYEVPPGVDTVKEHAWLSDQMKQWRDFQKSMDDRKEQLREKAAQIKLGPAPKIADLNAKMEELQQRIDATEAEEIPLKAELQQAQADLTQAQAADSGLDDKYYKQLYSLPGEAVTKHIPLATNGRFTWVEDDVFVEGEKEHHYWMFSRATRADGRQYWALQHFGIGKDETRELYLEPSSFISTKAILRPNLSPDEQEQ
jgi:predicted nuclease with TOPRIM domain